MLRSTCALNVRVSDALAQTSSAGSFYYENDFGAVRASMLTRPILLFGQFARDDLNVINEAAHQAACELSQADSLDQALAWLDGHEAHGILCHSEESEQLAVQTRSRAGLSRLPVLTLSDSITDLDFASAFSWGADDVAPLGSLRPLITRLRSLPKESPTAPVEKRGTALVAEADRTRRTTVARVLRNAGYTLRFAVTPEDTEHFVADPTLALVVVSKDLFPSAPESIQAARAAGSQANFVLCSPPRDIKHDRAALQGVSGVKLTDSFAAPENVLFVANELGGAFTNNRKSPRIPYGARVAFRSAGRDSDEYGYSYNISLNGIYVRTLAPPEDDEVWLELCPPRIERHVRLVGRVAWRRPFNYNENATVPPGFGVEIIDGAARDRALWAEGYTRLVETVGASKFPTG
ncbi:MAG: PilZ domain-containing protein [Myxococcota bacterium]